jgi:imidazolonepropionase-like amidohydrolase
VHLGSQSSPKSYEEEFRLDETDFAFRSVGYAKRPCWPASPACATSVATCRCTCATRSTKGLVDGPRIWAAGKIISTTGGHADPTNGYNAELSHLLGPPGPSDGVVNSVDDARQAVRQRYKEGSDVIKITATGACCRMRNRRTRRSSRSRRSRRSSIPPRITAIALPPMRTVRKA